VVLLHGWIASGGLNWYHLFEPLSSEYRVLAIDHRGHGRGVRSHRRFRLADCADDVAALLDQLDIPSAVMVGYSMGGPIAQLVWKRHRAKVDGLVLAATAQTFVPGMRARLTFTTAMAAAAGTTRAGQLVGALPVSVAGRLRPVAQKGRPDSFQRWAAAEMARHDWRMVLEAGHAIGHYNAGKWIGGVDVPTAAVITTRDRAIAPTAQARMAFSIPGATLHRVDDGHVVCASPRFVDPMVAAIADVATRAHP
jgi:pimeloyl-ACP methyl ester carboxylesterase